MGFDLDPSCRPDLLLVSPGRPRLPLRVLVLVASGTAGVLLGAAAVVAPAARASSAADIETRVHVLTGLTLSLPESFRVGGAPGVLSANRGSVVGTVLTNNAAGYTVSVLASSAGGLQPDPGLATGTGSIPWDRLEVREAGTGTFLPLREGEAVTVGGRSTPSGDETGEADVLHHDFRLTVPVVDADRYTGVLTYTATAL